MDVGERRRTVSERNHRLFRHWRMLKDLRERTMVTYQIMRTSQGVTPVGGVGFSFTGFSLLYAALGVTLIFLLRGLATGAPTTKEEASHVA